MKLISLEVLAWPEKGSMGAGSGFDFCRQNTRSCSIEMKKVTMKKVTDLFFK